VLLQASSQPRRGSFRIKPENGTAFSTKFQLFADGWVSDTRGSLVYQFSYSMKDQTVVLTDWSTSPATSTLLPAEVTTVRMSVCDRHGGVSTLEANVTVTTATTNSTAAIEHALAGPIDEAISRGDQWQGVSMLVAIASDLNQQNQTFSTDLKLRKALLGSLEQLAAPLMVSSSGRDQMAAGLASVLSKPLSISRSSAMAGMQMLRKIVAITEASPNELSDQLRKDVVRALSGVSDVAAGTLSQLF
jgi:hypothetical protein